MDVDDNNNEDTNDDMEEEKENEVFHPRMSPINKLMLDRPSNGQTQIPLLHLSVSFRRPSTYLEPSARVV